MLKIFRKLGLLETMSFLILISIAMPLKYWGGYVSATKIIGMIHGLLFLSYIFAANHLAFKLKWPLSKLFLAYLAAIIPCGTFLFDRYFFVEKKSIEGN
jgi:integral membrane protein